MGERAASAIGAADLEDAERRSRLGAEHARRHLALLAEGSRALVAGLDDEVAALRSLAAAIVPSFADWCAIDVVEDGQVRRMASVHTDPSSGELLPGLQAERPGWAAPVCRVMATGKGELVWDAAASPDHAEDADHLGLLRALGLVSTLTAPIRIQGIAVGAITCATGPGRRGYRPADLAAVEELAARTAMAMERISLYQETRRAGAATAERAGQLRRLVDSALALQPQHTAMEVAEVVAGQACRLLGARHALVSLSGPEGPVRVTAGSAGRWSDEHARLVERAERGDVGDASTLVDPRSGAVDALAVRLNDHNARPIGALVVAGKESGTLTDDGSILVALAQLASAALDNARLYESVRAGEAHLAALVETSPLAILEVDLAGRVRRTNRAAVRLLGGDRGGKGEAGGDLALHPETATLLGRLAADTLAGQPVGDLEVVARRVDGSEVPVSLTGAPLQDAAGAVGGVVVMAADVTVRRQLEEQLIRARGIEAVGQVAGGVAHDFSNLLTVILGHAALLDDGLAEGDSRRADVQAIVVAAERAAGVTSQLLTISRGDPVATEAFDPRDRLRRLATTLRSLLPESVDLDLSVAPGEALVRLSPAQFDQVLLNLAVNSRDAVSGSGRLTVTLREQDRWVVIEVADTGTGMDAVTAERCFEPFFSTKGRGTGLGLATVHSVVTGVGGQVSLSTAPGQGTTFTVRLPLVVGTVAAGVPARPHARAGFESILVVEDEAGLRRLAVEALRRAGYVVTPAADGQAALQLLAAGDTPPELVVTDVVMPRVGGVELAERLAVLHPDVPVLFMTGYVDQTSRRGLVGADVLIKPFVITELVARVEEALDRASAARRPAPGPGDAAQGSKR